MYFTIPLADSLPVSVGKKIARFAVLSIALAEGSALAVRLYDPELYIESFGNETFGSQVDNNGTAHKLLSTFDVLNSLTYIIIALTIETAWNSFRHQECAVGLLDAVLLRDIVSAGPGNPTIASALLGRIRGSVIESKCTRASKWLILLAH